MILTTYIEAVNEEVEFDVDYDAGLDGIGHYEFWGQKSYDKSTPYFIVENLTIHHKQHYTDGETQAIYNEIEHWSDDKWNEITNYLKEK